jgi:hypothetical protein
VLIKPWVLKELHRIHEKYIPVPAITLFLFVKLISSFKSNKLRIHFIIDNYTYTPTALSKDENLLKHFVGFKHI